MTQYIAAVDSVCSLLRLCLNGACSIVPMWKTRIGSALVALVAVDIFEPEEFSVVCEVQCFALHLLAPYPNTNS